MSRQTNTMRALVLGEFARTVIAKDEKDGHALFTALNNLLDDPEFEPSDVDAWKWKLAKDEFGRLNGRRSWRRGTGRRMATAETQDGTESVAPVADAGEAKEEQEAEEKKEEESSPLTPHGGMSERGIGFDEIYKAWGKCAQKNRAREEWKKALKSSEFPGVEAVFEAAKRWGDAPRWRMEGRRYQPSLANWLADQRWNEPPPEAEKSHALNVIPGGDAYANLI